MLACNDTTFTKSLYFFQTKDLNEKNKEAFSQFCSYDASVSNKTVSNIQDESLKMMKPH